MHTSDACKIYSVLETIYIKEDTSLCFLEFDNPFEILVMTILSAQTTDKNVNKIKSKLFEKYPDCKKLADAELSDLEEIIRSTGFYHSKAKNLISASKLLCSEFNCEIPKTINELIRLPGVGRKTANIVLSHAYGINEGIAVDTHVKRLSIRLGFTDNADPDKIEEDLKALFPASVWDRINFLLISHGRAVCNAKKPECERCEINSMCRFYKNKEQQPEL